MCVLVSLTLVAGDNWEICCKDTLSSMILLITSDKNHLHLHAFIKSSNIYLVLPVRWHYSRFWGWSIEQVKYPTLRKLILF